MSEHYSTPEQALIERLRRAPQPELSSEARAMIRARMLDALDHPPAPRRVPSRPMMAVAAAVVAVTLMVGAALLVLSQQNQTVITPTAPATFTLIPPTETSTPTASPTVTASPTLTLTPTVVPTASMEVISIVEGPVQKVDGNVITIYGTPIQIPPDTTVIVGDVVRVESSDQSGTSQVITVTPIAANGTPPAETNPSSGEVWHDDGTCSHPPPDWAPANGWRRRCQGQEKDKDKGGKHDKGDG
jgi:hypothetical protein